MEYPAPLQQGVIHLLRPEHHIRPWISIEGEGAVAVLIQLDKGKGRGHPVIPSQGGAVNTGFLHVLLKKAAKGIPAHLAHKGGASAQLGCHSQYVGRRTARVLAEQRHSHLIDAGGRKVDQTLAQCYYVIHVFTSYQRGGRLLPPALPLGHSSQGATSIRIFMVASRLASMY